jgi:hypothetical protein
MPITLKITDMFYNKSSYPSDNLRTSTLSNFTLEKRLTADNLAEEELDCRNLKNSGSRRSPAAASAAQDDFVIVVVPVGTVVERFEFGDN